MNAISFSLFGSNPRYCVGAIRNAEVVRTIYPAWRAIFFVDGSVPKDVQRELLDTGAEVRIQNSGIRNGMFWRFLINDDPSVERYIIRDADSCLTLRERTAVDAWIESGRRFHIMRDHRCHVVPMLGGMWGAIAGSIPNMAELITNSNLAQDCGRRTMYGKDQTFLAQFIWPLAEADCLQHDSRKKDRFPGSVEFPTRRNGRGFVGQIWTRGSSRRN